MIEAIHRCLLFWCERFNFSLLYSLLVELTCLEKQHLVWNTQKINVSYPPIELKSICLCVQLRTYLSQPISVSIYISWSCFNKSVRLFAWGHHLEPWGDVHQSYELSDHFECYAQWFFKQTWKGNFQLIFWERPVIFVWS